MGTDDVDQDEADMVELSVDPDEKVVLLREVYMDGTDDVEKLDMGMKACILSDHLQIEVNSGELMAFSSMSTKNQISANMINTQVDAIQTMIEKIPVSTLVTRLAPRKSKSKFTTNKMRCRREISSSAAKSSFNMPALKQTVRKWPRAIEKQKEKKKTTHT